MKKIIIIDDEADWANLLKRRLEHNNYAVVVAADGVEGLEKLRSERPDMMILDVTMPNMDGLTFLQEYKSWPDFEDIPVLLFSGNDSMKDLFRAEGVREFIVKPADTVEILQKVQALIGE